MTQIIKVKTEIYLIVNFLIFWEVVESKMIESNSSNEQTHQQTNLSHSNSPNLTCRTDKLIKRTPTPTLMQSLTLTPMLTSTPTLMPNAASDAVAVPVPKINVRPNPKTDLKANPNAYPHSIPPFFNPHPTLPAPLFRFFWLGIGVGVGFVLRVCLFDELNSAS